jgi:sugar phosphate isomerase/epimerase
MIRSAVTISLVSAACGGPFIFWDDLAGSIQRAAELGYDAVELFLPGPDAVEPKSLRSALNEANLSVAAVGTGAGMLRHQLSLTDSDPDRRKAAREFVEGMIRLGGEFAAPAIIGSMQGRWSAGTEKSGALTLLADALQNLGEVASEAGCRLIYEPLNRYETNLCNTVADGVSLIRTHGVENVVLLADLFHMNIEETSLASALRDGGPLIGHVHFVDSNRRPAGCGHLDYAPIAAALREIGYQGYASAEAFPWPDSQTAAEKTIQTFRRVFGVEPA